MARRPPQARNNLPIAFACAAFGTFTFLFPLLLRCVPLVRRPIPFGGIVSGGRVTAMEGQSHTDERTPTCPDMFRTIAANAKRAP
jgi:hypothetical protein